MKLTYLNSGALWDLALAVQRIDRRGLDGVILEAGCALGGSALVLAAAKSPDRQLLVFDNFGMIPPPSQDDGPDVWTRYATIVAGKSSGIGGDRYYGYEDNLLARVEGAFSDFGLPLAENNVVLVKGLYSDTLRLSDPVALAHVDCDWYRSVMDCLNEIVPRLVEGGVLVIDDYEKWSGCRKAVDEYFGAAELGAFEFVHESRLQIIRRTAR